MSVGRRLEEANDVEAGAVQAGIRGESDTNLTVMAEIDRQFLDTPFYGVRQMTWHLRSVG